MFGKSQSNNMTYGIVGIGRFGFALSQELATSGAELIVLDRDENKVREMREITENAYVVRSLDKKSLEETGIQEADAVVIGIGKDIEGSILATLNIQEFGIRRIIAKVVSRDHAKILQKLGVEVIFPEVEIGRRTGMRLCETLAEDVLPLSDEFSILQIKTPEQLDGKTVEGIALRKRWGVSLIATIKDGKANGSIGPDTVLSSDETMVLSGSNRLLEKFQQAFI